jgi:hypothetical protein
MEDYVAYLHAVCFSPIKDTWIKPIQAGNFAGWSDLTPDRFHTYLHKADATIKGHLSQKHQNTRLTQRMEPQVDPEPDISQEGKTHYVFAKVVESGQIHSDITGQFPTKSSRGNTYFLVLYAYDLNNITTEPMQNRGGARNGQSI